MDVRYVYVPDLKSASGVTAKMRLRARILIVIAIALGFISAGASGSELEGERYREHHRGPQRPMVPPGQLTSETQACYERLAKIAHFAATGWLTQPIRCAVTELVRLEHVKMSDQTRVVIIPPATLRCRAAEEVAQWIREDLGPAMTEFGPLNGLSGVGSFECRGRNGVTSAKLSEHAKANAIDINVLKFRNGRLIKLTDTVASSALREKIRSLACKRFTTVLGPGSDAYHNDHIHLDLVQRSSGYRICQWNVSEPLKSAQIPLPPPKPRNVDARSRR
jgi:hypothetical protein